MHVKKGIRMEGTKDIRLFVAFMSFVICFLLFIFCWITDGFSEELIGNASWYSKCDPTDPFIHKITASGEKFNENAFTCALRWRSFGRYYKITNLANGKSVIVKHTDFGPSLKYNGKRIDRVVDLSKAAFRKIADLKTGIIKVKVEGYEKIR